MPSEMDTLRFERDLELPGLATVTLNRPEKLNAINQQMHLDLLSVCSELADDPSIRVLILTGEGRAFSSGADLGPRRGSAPGGRRPSWPLAQAPLAARLQSSLGNRSSAALESLDQVTIGAVNGLAIGGAVVWLACVDIRLAAESAWFSIPEVDLDLPLTWNALPRLVRELGPARTKELVLACDRFTSGDALRWGFVNRVLPDAELMAATKTLAGRLLAKDPIAVALTKSTVNALANLMVPLEATHADRDYLVLSRLLAAERES